MGPGQETTMSLTRTLTFVTAASLVLMGSASFVSAAPGGNGTGNSYEDVDIQLNLTGVATRTSGGPDAGFVFYINASGEGVRRTPQGNGVQIKSDGLEAEVKIVNTATNETVAQYTAIVGFHAQQAAAIAQGLEPGNFKFNLGLHGKRSENVLSIETGDRVMSMNAHGTTLGAGDDDGAHAIQGKGQTTLKDGRNGNGATHYNFQLGGTGSILSAE
jgi:hypothetical protein